MMNNTLGVIAEYSKERISLEDITLETYVTTDNLLQNKQGKIKADKLPPNGGNVTKFDFGDILIANIRPYLKKIWLANGCGGSSADVLTLKVNENHDSTFIYYALFRDDFFQHMMNGVKGTKMPRGDKNQVLDFPIPAFNKQKQSEIAKVLSDLDTKIELNNKINQQLEAMVKILYDYWFVQFDFPDAGGNPYKSSGGKMVYDKKLKREIPVGWEVVTLSDCIKNDKSGDWGKDLEQGNYTQKVSCIRGADLNGLNGKGKIKSPTRYILEKNIHKLLEINDLIIEMSGGSPTQSTGRLAFITKETLSRSDNPLICSNFCKAVTLKNPKYLYNFACQWNRLYDAGVLFGWEGKTSGIKKLLFDSFINNYYVELPKFSVIENFYKFSKTLHSKKQKNLIENDKLEKLRDWLLPMLMNGQVTVKEAQEEIQMNRAAESKAEYKINE